VAIKSALSAALRKSLSIGLYRAIRLLGKELVSYRNHRIGMRKARAYRGKTGLKLNIGCGPNPKQGWLNIDLSRAAELSLDMREHLPFDDGSVATIYSEHFIEHLDYPDDAHRFLGECFRVLQPNGVFRVGVPDTLWPARDYAGGGDGSWLRALSKGEIWHPAWCKTPLDHINYHFRQDEEHRYAYDFETMEKILEEAGFIEVNESEFDPDLDTEARRLGTLYLNATKPP
jgi:predicted SAM-dependent methyltransferase